MRRFLIIISAVIIGILFGLLLRTVEKGKKRDEAPASSSTGRVFGTRRPVGPRIALVLDDWGHNVKHLDDLSEIIQPLTLAVLPDLRFSEEICRKAPSLGCQVILHLPLAPLKEKVSAGPLAIAPGMSREEIVRLVEKALAGVTGIVGVSNHMGSAATADRDLMRVVLERIAREKLFFLDSLTTPYSVCSRICEKLKVRYLQRDLFLDVDIAGGMDDGYEKIAGRLRELGRIAKKSGKAVGIGHDRMLTLMVIRDLAPKMEREGFRFVYLSELVE